MRALAFNAYTHDAGLAVADDDGGLLFSVEEERFDRVRKTGSFPFGGVHYLRRSLGIELADLDQLAFPWHFGRIVRMGARLVFGRFPPAFRLLTRAASLQANFPAALKFLGAGREIARAFGASAPRRVRWVPHHLAHACNAYFLSPFDRAAVLILDAYGDECSTSAYTAQGARLSCLGRNHPMDSLGILYAIVTKYLGYRTVLDEGKVMALAAHGSDALLEDFRRLVRLLPGGRYRLDRRFFSFQRYGEVRPFSKAFLELFGPARRPEDPLAQRHRDLAFALQRTLEEVILHAVRHLREATAERDLCLGGGVALNCLANGRVAREGGFDRVYVPPNPSDAGVPLGAALALTHLGQAERQPAGAALGRAGVTPFLGPCYAREELASALEKASVPFREERDPPRFAARELAAGRIVAWFQGASEAGPRALGHRSLLADPRDPGVVDRLKREVKRREAFRPFGPSVLAERASDFFEALPPSPYMSFAVPTRPERRGQVPAVVARDGTSRVHTVESSPSCGFRALIEAFEQETGIPMVLNTSFNVHEPMVCSPEDAVRTFLRSPIDTLVLGPFVAARRGEPFPTGNRRPA